MAEPSKKNLGRGLSALLGDAAEDYATLDKALRQKNIGIELIEPSRFQPRRKFDQVEIESLAQSIKNLGIVQPLLVRRHVTKPGHYELIAGERRWRAAQLAKIHDVPAVIRDLTDRQAMEMALIENIQRQDLTPIEEAEGYQRLITEFKYTQEELADMIGKSRSHLTNMLRLLSLPEVVKKLIEEGKLSAGHAKTIAGQKDAEKMALEIVAKGLSVRQTEKLVKIANENKKPKISGQAANTQGPNADIKDLEKQLERVLGLRVGIQFSGKAGNVTIHFQDLDQFDMILKKLKG